MLLIPCPWCGPRAEIEFFCGGEAHRGRPAQTLATTDEEWADYLFRRHNPKGPGYERWQHRHGCGLWFNVARDTVTHRISTAYAIDAAAPPTDAPVAS